MKIVAVKFVQKLLNFEQKQCRVSIALLPDLAPCDFFLFPELKKPMKGKRFATIDEIKSDSNKELMVIPKSVFQKSFEDWKKGWHMRIISEGDLFERDKIDIDE